MSEYGPEFDHYAERVRRELAPMIQSSGVCVSITPSSPKDVDVKFAVELGLMILFDKPIIALVKPGTKVPEKLVKVADRIVEFDVNEPGSADRLRQAINEITEEKGLAKDPNGGL